jgi:integrase/recombinase XerD
LALALVRDPREHRAPASAEELADFETDVLAGFVLAEHRRGWPTAPSATTPTT